MADLTLDTPVQFVPGVGPRRAQQLAGLGVVTLGDLLTYFPRRFDLRKQVQLIDTLADGQEAATVAGTVLIVRMSRFGRKAYFQCEIEDETASVQVGWFYGNYLSSAESARGWSSPSAEKSPATAGNCGSSTRDTRSSTTPRRPTSAATSCCRSTPPGPGCSSGVIAQIIQTRPARGGAAASAAWFDASTSRERELMPRPAGRRRHAPPRGQPTSGPRPAAAWPTTSAC